MKNIFCVNYFVELFQLLFSQQGTLTITILALSAIGIVRQFCLVIRFWISDKLFVNAFIRNAAGYIEGYCNNTDNNPQAVYLVRNYEKFSKIIGTDRIDFPEIDIVSSIRYNTYSSSNEYTKILRRLTVLFHEWDARRISKRWVMLIELIFPILFWFFRGVEYIVMLITYILKELGFKEIQSEGKVIKVLSVIFTIVTGLASLFSYLNIELF